MKLIKSNIITIKLKLFVVLILMSMCINPLFAQDDGGPEPDPPPPGSVPLDGGLSVILLAGAALFGGKKFYQDKNKKDKL